MKIVNSTISENIIRSDNAVRTYGGVKRIFYVYPSSLLFVVLLYFPFLQQYEKGKEKNIIFFIFTIISLL